MNEAREAFERHEAKVAQVPYDEFKLRFDSYEEKIGERYIDGSVRHKHWVTWLAAWQEQQKRIDAIEQEVRIFSQFIKRFNENTDKAIIVGTMDGFVEGLERALRGEHE